MTWKDDCRQCHARRRVIGSKLDICRLCQRANAEAERVLAALARMAPAEPPPALDLDFG